MIQQRSFWITLLVTWALATLSCSTADQVPSRDIEVEAAIQKTAADHAAATNSQGARGYASYATADARWLPPESPALSGREAIERWFSPPPGFSIAWEHPHVVVSRSGDIAYSVGTYKLSGQDRDGRTQVTEGKLVNVWHKQADGSWKIAVGIWNTNVPPTAPVR